MKKRKIRKIFLLSLVLGSCCIFSAACGSASVENNAKQERTTNPADYEENTRERYVANLAQQEGVSYETADQMEQEQISDITLNETEILKYRTIDKAAGIIQGGNGYSISAHISTEIRYIYDEATNSSVSLNSLGHPHIYLPDISDSTITGGEFNLKNDGVNGRISITASVNYSTSDTDIDIGNDITDVTVKSGKSSVITKAKTFAIDIDELNLK